MILIMAGSNSKVSINQAVAKEISIYLNCFYYDTRRINIPVFNRDKKVKSEILNLYNLIQEYSDIIIVNPEYNRGITPFLKNLLDGLSTYDRYFLQNKKLYVVSVSPGKLGGRSSRKTLCSILPCFGGNVVFEDEIANYTIIEDFKQDIQDIANQINKLIL